MEPCSNYWDTTVLEPCSNCCIPRADFQWVEVNRLNIEMQGLHGICYFVHVLKDTEQSSGVICEPL